MRIKMIKKISFEFDDKNSINSAALNMVEMLETNFDMETVNTILKLARYEFETREYNSSQTTKPFDNFEKESKND